MKLTEIFNSSDKNHHIMMTDIDHFTASPRANLKPETIKFLKSKQTKISDMTLYRVLFTYELEALTRTLGANDLTKGVRVTHKASRVSSWSKDVSVVKKLATENDNLGDYAIILKANIPGKSILLDLDDLSNNDKQYIYTFSQKEVIVDAGDYHATVIDIIDL